MEDHVIGDKGWEAYIFCKKHIKKGCEDLQMFGVSGIKGNLIDPSKEKQNRLNA